MKKITLLITLMLSCFAFGQQILLQDFQTSSSFTFAGFEGLGKLTANNVPPVEGAFIVADPASGGTRGLGLQLKSSALGNPWQGAEFVFTGSTRIRLTTDKTMKVDVYSTKAFTMLAKVESGTGPNSATSASYTTPNQWQTLTFTFNTSSDGTAVANGDYAKIVFFPGRNATNTGWAAASDFNVHVDNVTGVSATAAPDPAPTTAAPTPPARNAVDVISLFSNAYTNKIIENWSANYDDSDISDVVIANNDVKKIKFTNFLGVQFTTPANRIDLTPMTHMHIDIWTATPTLDKTFGPKLSNWAKGSGEANAILFTATNASTPSLPNPNPGTWISLDIPLSSFSAGARNDIAELIFTSAGPGSLGLVYMDNVYFWRDPLPAGTPTISFTIPEKSVSDAAFSLTSLITSNSPGAITYSSSNTNVATVSGSTVTIIGVGSTTITANQAAGGTYNAGSKTAVLDVNPIAAPIPPTVTPSSVIGLYGETYPITGYIDGFGSVGTADLDTGVGVNNALKYNFANGGYGQTFTTKDISTMGFVHFDYYTTNATAFKLFMISANPTFEAIYDIPNITQNQWVGVNVPMSVFTNNPSFKATDFFQFKFDVAAATPTAGTVFIDNLYFSITNPALGTEKFEASKVKMYPNPAKNTLNIDANASIQKVAVYNILGQEVLSKKPNSNSTTLQTSGLQRGTYIVRSTIDGKTTTSKLIKE